MSDLIRDLGATDPGLLYFVGLLSGAIIVIVFVALCGAWDSRPTRVSHSELNHRLDAEGLAKYSRPATSNRKSGRVSG